MDSESRFYSVLVISVALVIGVLGFRGCSTSELAAQGVNQCATTAYEACVAAGEHDCGAQASLACRGGVGRAQ
jgi:hypothetical protein